METDKILYDELQKVLNLYETCNLQKTKDLCKELEKYILELIQNEKKEVYHAKTS